MKAEFQLLAQLRTSREFDQVERKGITGSILSTEARNIFNKLETHYLRNEIATEGNLIKFGLDIDWAYEFEPINGLIDEIKQTYARRVLEDSFIEGAKELSRTSNSLEVLDKLLKQHLELQTELNIKTNRVDTALTAGTRYQRYLELANRTTKMLGPSTGVPELDEITLGIKPGRVFTLCGSPKVGKTSFACKTALAQMKQGYKPYFVSLELSVDDIELRLDAMYSGLSMTKIASGDLSSADTKLLEEKQKQMSEEGSIIIEKLPVGQRTPAAIIQKARAEGCDSIIIDQLTFVESSKNIQGGPQQLEHIFNELKALVSEDEDKLMPVLILHQLNRTTDSSKPVGYGQIFGSSVVERTSDFVAVLTQSKEEAFNELVKLELIANRFGVLDQWLLNWRFTDYTDTSTEVAIDKTGTPIVREESQPEPTSIEIEAEIVEEVKAEPTKTPWEMFKEKALARHLEAETEHLEMGDKILAMRLELDSEIRGASQLHGNSWEDTVEIQKEADAITVIQSEFVPSLLNSLRIRMENEFNAKLEELEPIYIDDDSANQELDPILAEYRRLTKERDQEIRGMLVGGYAQVVALYKDTEGLRDLKAKLKEYNLLEEEEVIAPIETTEEPESITEEEEKKPSPDLYQNFKTRVQEELQELFEKGHRVQPYSAEDIDRVKVITAEVDTLMKSRQLEIENSTEEKVNKLADDLIEFYNKRIAECRRLAPKYKEVGICYPYTKAQLRKWDEERARRAAGEEIPYETDEFATKEQREHLDRTYNSPSRRELEREEASKNLQKELITEEPEVNSETSQEEGLESIVKEEPGINLYTFFTTLAKDKLGELFAEEDSIKKFSTREVEKVKATIAETTEIMQKMKETILSLDKSILETLVDQLRDSFLKKLRGCRIEEKKSEPEKIKTEELEIIEGKPETDMWELSTKLIDEGLKKVLKEENDKSPFTQEEKNRIQEIVSEQKAKLATQKEAVKVMSESLAKNMANDTIKRWESKIRLTMNRNMEKGALDLFSKAKEKHETKTEEDEVLKLNKGWEQLPADSSRRKAMEHYTWYQSLSPEEKQIEDERERKEGFKLRGGQDEQENE